MGANRQRIETTLPRDGELNPAKQVSESSLSLVSKFVSIRQQMMEGTRDLGTGDLDKLASPFLDAALDRHPNLKELEGELGCTKAYVSQLRNGHVAAPMRVLVPLLQHPPVVHEFASQILVAAGLPRPEERHELNREDVLEVALAMLAEGPLLKSLIRECGEKYGASPAAVLHALSNK